MHSQGSFLVISLRSHMSQHTLLLQSSTRFFSALIPPSILLSNWLLTCYHHHDQSLSHVFFFSANNMSQIYCQKLVILHKLRLWQPSTIPLTISTYYFLKMTHIAITHIYSTFVFTSNYKVWKSKFHFSYTTIFNHDIMIKVVQESNSLGSMDLIPYPQVTCLGCNLSSIHLNSIVVLR